MATVREETHRVLRALGLTTIFGNPGSTELPFLRDFPCDFRYFLGLHEGVVVGMADGFAQASRHPALVNLHTAVGLGNAMGAIITAFHNKTPLVITAGQQTRSTMLMEPFLYAREAAELPKPYVKWSYETARPQDVPGSLARAYYTAIQPPQGPVFVSIPMDDFNAEAERVVLRSVTCRVAADPYALDRLAHTLAECVKPAFVVGAGVDRNAAWDLMIRVAERTNAAVWGAPLASRIGFPQRHPLFQGFLPFARAPLAERLEGYDLVIVVGAPIFNYLVDVPGQIVPDGVQLFQITDDPREAERAPAGTGIVGDTALSLEYLLTQLPEISQRPRPSERPPVVGENESSIISAGYLMHTLAELLPDDAVLVDESPSATRLLRTYVSTSRSGGYYATGSGCLGFAMPAAIGIQLAQPTDVVVCVVGDGSAMYSIQSLCTAAQHGVPVIYVVARNFEYAVLKALAKFGDAAHIPGLDLPPFDLLEIARGLGCEGHRVERPDELRGVLRQVLTHRSGPVLIEVIVDPTAPSLIG
jgi:benzoylformate decarboxylase